MCSEKISEQIKVAVALSNAKMIDIDTTHDMCSEKTSEQMKVLVALSNVKMIERHNTKVSSHVYVFISLFFK